MTNQRDLRLDRYGIKKNRYRELKYFCLQYQDKKTQLLSITEIGSANIDGVGGGSRLSDRTATTVIKRIALENDVKLIERVAIDTDSEIYQYIIESVTKGIPWEYLGVPCSRRQFYRLRRKFFYLLSLAK